jgi:hypothetical protein
VPISVAVLLLRSTRYECPCAEALVVKHRPAENAAARIKPQALKPKMIFIMDPSQFSQQNVELPSCKKAILLL